jgi:MFS family permease
MVLLAARTISMGGFVFAPVALAFGILDLEGGNEWWISAVLGCQLVPEAALALAGGVVADRYPRARVLQAGLAAAGVGWFAIGWMMVSGFAPLWLMCLAAAFAGVASSLVYPALTGIIPDLVPSLQLQQANAWLGMGTAVARLAGLVAGGAVVVAVGGGWAMVFAAALYIGAGALALGLPIVKDSLVPAENALRQLAEGWREVKSRQWLWVVIAQFGLMVMALEALIGVLGPLLAQRELTGAIVWGSTPLPGKAVWTLILVGQGVGATLGVVVSLRWRPQRPILAGAVFTVFAAGPPLLLGLGAHAWVVVGSAALMGVGFEVFNVLYMTTLQNEIPPHLLSRVAAYDAFGSLVLAPLGAVIAAPAAVWLGVRPAITWTGLLILAVTLATICAPGVRRLRVRPPRLP